MNETFDIGGWHFDATSGRLTRPDGIGVPLEDRAARTLRLLCRRRGEVVSKAEILADVWQGRTVSSNSVAIVIGDLRSAIEADREQPVHIATIGRRGYRLEPPAHDGAITGEGRGGDRRSPITAMIVLLGIVAAIVGITLMHSASRPVLIVAATRNETGRPELEALARSLTAVVTGAASKLPDISVEEARGTVAVRTGTVRLQSRVIIWNGAPEVALSATEIGTNRVVWTAFASGPQALLARQTSRALATLPATLHH